MARRLVDQPWWQLTTRPWVGLALGLAGIAGAVVLFLVAPRPAAWYQLAAAGFWVVVGPGFLVSALAHLLHERRAGAGAADDAPRSDPAVARAGGPGGVGELDDDFVPVPIRPAGLRRREDPPGPTAVPVPAEGDTDRLRRPSGDVPGVAPPVPSGVGAPPGNGTGVNGVGPQGSGLDGPDDARRPAPDRTVPQPRPVVTDRPASAGPAMTALVPPPPATPEAASTTAPLPPPPGATDVGPGTGRGAPGRARRDTGPERSTGAPPRREPSPAVGPPTSSAPLLPGRRTDPVEAVPAPRGRHSAPAPGPATSGSTPTGRHGAPPSPPEPAAPAARHRSPDEDPSSDAPRSRHGAPRR